MTPASPTNPLAVLGSPLELIQTQPSHLLLVLSNAAPEREHQAASWYRGDYLKGVAELPCVVSVEYFEQHDVDIGQGEYPRLPFRYLGLHMLSIDGGEESLPVIEHVTELHRRRRDVELPATWLYYPLSRRVGREPSASPSMLTVAFANPVAGQEHAFREWYATRHIRHALNIRALVSGQTFERAQFQHPGSMPADFHTIALYEQDRPPEEIIQAFASLPPETFAFPAMDESRFAEWSYLAL
jgi:hypothetical protein